MKREASADWGSVEEDENEKVHRIVVDGEKDGGPFASTDVGGGNRVIGNRDSGNSEFETQQFDFLASNSTFCLRHR